MTRARNNHRVEAAEPQPVSPWRARVILLGLGLGVFALVGRAF